MRVVLGWLVVVAALLMILGLIGWARGAEHHRGDEVGAVTVLLPAGPTV